MKDTHLTLLDGTFDSNDAKDILLALFRNKVNYHNLKNFRAKEMTGIPSAHCVERIEALKQSIETVLELMAEANANGKEVRLSSEVKIEFI